LTFDVVKQIWIKSYLYSYKAFGSDKKANKKVLKNVNLSCKAAKPTVNLELII